MVVAVRSSDPKLPRTVRVCVARGVPGMTTGGVVSVVLLQATCRPSISKRARTTPSVARRPRSEGERRASNHPSRVAVRTSQMKIGGGAGGGSKGATLLEPAVVLTVMVDITVAAPGTGEDGWNTQVTPVGGLVQESPMELSNRPPTGIRVTV